MDTHTLALFSDLSTHPVNVCLVVNRSKGHLQRVFYRMVQAHTQAPFRIHGHKQRCFRQGVPFVCLYRLCHRIAFKKDDAPYIVPADKLTCFLQVRFSRIIGTHKYKLGNSLIHCQRFVNRISPFFSILLQPGIVLCYDYFRCSRQENDCY